MSGSNGLPDNTAEQNALIYGSYPPAPLLFPTGAKTITSIDVNPEGRITSISSGSVPTGLALLVPVVISSQPYTVPTSQNTAVYGSALVGSDFTATLPAATGSGFINLLKKMDAFAHAVKFGVTGGDLIDGLSTYSLTTQFAAVWVQDSAIGIWSILGVYVP